MSDLETRLEGLSPARRALLLQRLRATPPVPPAEARRPSLTRRAAEQAPLSFAQQRLWFLSQLDPDSPVYHVPLAARLRGRLDLPALRRALEEVVRRHETLRTTFAVEGGQPVQRVAPRAPGEELPLTLVDLRQAGEGALDALLGAAIERPFDLARGPLLRVLVARLAEEEHVLLLTMHHIASDAWSAGVLLGELSALYRAFVQGLPSPLCELPVQYGDFAVWQREWLQGAVLEELLAAWRRSLEGASLVLDLPADRPRPALPSFRGGARPIHLEALTEAVRSFGREKGASPFIVLLAAFAWLLGRSAGQEQVVVGTPIANRTHADLEGLIGFFVNSLALRIDLAGDPSFGALVARVRERVLEAFAHQDLPFERLVEELRVERDPGRAPVFQVVLQYREEPRADLDLPGLRLELLEVEARTAKLDLVVNLTEQGGLGGVWKYATDLFDATTAERMVGHYGSLLAGALAAPERQLSGIDLLSSAERQAVLVEWNGAAPPAAAAGSLVERFARQAARTPAAVALEHEGRTLAYAELAGLARRLARHLRAAGVLPGDLVGVLLDRSPDLVVAVLGVLEAGAAYVPLDPAYPPERLRFVLEDTRAAVVVSDDASASRLPEGPRVVKLDREAGAIARRPDGPLPPPAPADPAYVIYTSGSTGRPKGVMVTHSQVVRLFEATRAWFDFGADDVWTLFHSYAFDFSVWEIWGALLQGGRLVVVPWSVSRSPAAFHALLRERGVTVLNQTPSAFRQLLAADAASPELTSLRWVVFGGEALDPRALAPWWQRYGGSGARLVNMYGITETTVHVTGKRLEPADTERGSVIGVPIPDLRVYVVDPAGGPSPVGVPGELWVGGAGVAAGYLGRPELTAQRFVPDPWSGEPGARLYRSGDLGRWRPDGELEYLGRIDHQVKVRGFRIEPGEIEAVLAAHPAVREAAVLALDQRLVAFLVAADGERPALPELRAFAAGRLPDYMVPATFQWVAALPLTPTGKLDRRGLARLAEPLSVGESEGRPFMAPRTPLEERVAAAWREVLAMERIGVDDDFFELGGDSIRAAVLANRLQELVGEIVHVVAVFDAPRLGDLAAYLEEHYPAAAARLGAATPRVSARLRVDEAAVARARALIRPLGPAPAADVAGPNPPAVFVLSPPRSGTTLLRVLLGGHPRLFSPPELELLSYRTLAERRDAFSGRDAFWLEGAIRAVMELWGCGPEEAREKVARCECEGWSTRRFYRFLQEALGERRLVDKTPSYALDPAVLARAEQEFEGALYLHLVRHPCGMIRSFEEARLDQIFFRHSHGFGRRELAELIWTISHRNVLGFLARVPPERQHRVVFEDLVREPRRVVEEICAFLGLGFDPRMIDPYADGDRRMTDGLHAESRMLGDVKFHRYRRIEAGVADGWRGELDERSLGEPTIELARELGCEVAEPLPPIPVAGPEAGGEAPPSFSQERLWFLDQLEPGLPAYNLALAVRLSGRLDAEAFGRALTGVARRHSVLRTTFAAREGRPVQVVHPPAPVALPVVDLTACPEPEREPAARRLAAEEGWQAFDLAAGPLLRAYLLRLAEREHWLLLTLHHIVADGWSLGVLLREVAALYEAYAAGRAPDLPDLPLQYTDFARWQRSWLAGEELKRQIGWWREQLAGLQPLELPTDRPRPPVQTFRGAQRQAELPAAAWRGVAALALHTGATPFMTLLAAFQALLYRYTGQERIAVGIPTANRNRSELEGLVGFFVNLLVMSTDLSGDPTFRELVGRVRETALGAYAHQDVPFEKLVEELRPRRDPSRNPLFQAAFQTRIPAFDAPRLAEPALEPLDLESRISKFDLKLGLGDGRDDLGVSLEHNTDLFDGSTAGRLLAHFGELLEGAAAEPDRRLSELPLLTRAERFQLAVEWNDTVSDYPAGSAVHELVSRQARSRPGEVAVDSPEEALTYAELEGRANRLARHLISLGVVPGALVGVCLERSAALVVSLLGILKTGAAYVPLDPAYPAERLAFMAEDATLSAVISREGLAERLPGGTPRVLLDAERPRIEALSPDPLPAAVGGDALAYLIYTSGSTGRPKGAAVPHRAIVRLVAGADYVQLDPEDRVAQAASVSFDAATFEVWGPLVHGGCIVGIPRDVSLSPDDLAAELRQRKVTTLFLTTALFNQIAMQAPDAFRGLRHVLFGGEAVTPHRVRRVLEAGPPRRLLHVYGPTENTTFSSWLRVAEVPEGAATIPIGHPIANSTLYVLDPELQPVPVGVPGELYTGGDGLAWGYWRRPELTAERFVPGPFGGRPGARLYRTGDRVRRRADGSVEFLGRFDHQVKVRGFRVEPGEIEAELTRHPAIREAVVLALEGAAPGDRRLVAFASPRLGENPGDLRSYLQDRLPAFLVPSTVHLLDALPLNPNGKVDRGALAELASRARTGPQDGFVAPRTPREGEIAALWAELLGCSSVGVHDDFFELGGHSLLATQLASRLRKLYGADLPLRLVFEHPTVAGLAALIDEGAAADAGPEPIERIAAAGAGLDDLLAELDLLSDEEAAELLSGNERMDA